jgi:adenosine deaminase
VHIALHAGELGFGLVPPTELGTHIPKAIDMGHAERIGHGTDIMHYSKPDDLMKEMVEKRVAVEISPTSSDLILGIKGAAHPLRGYVKAGVPVVIATDDAGVARSDLTNEYMRAVMESGLGYEEIKKISMDSASYTFLREYCPAGMACDCLPLMSCHPEFVLLQRLEKAFKEFERTY